MTCTVNDILSTPRSENISERLVQIVRKAAEEAINYGTTRFIEPAHLLSAMLAHRGQGTGASIAMSRININHLEQFREMLSEPVSRKYDHLSCEQLNNPDFIKMWNMLMDAFPPQESYEENITYSKIIDSVLEKAEEIAHKLGNNDFDSGELLAAILDVCKNDLRIKLFIKKTGVTYESVLERLSNRDRDRYYRRTMALEESHSFNL